MLPSQPSPADVRALRKAAGLTQTQLGELVGAKLRTAQSWEAEGDNARGIDAASWALLRARIALLMGDPKAALAVLKEAL